MASSQLKKKEDKVLVIFGEDFPTERVSKKKFDTVVADKMFRKKVESLGIQFTELEKFIEPWSIYEASSFAEELSHLTLPDGSRLTKASIYEGYELWWIHHDNLFLYFCLPYAQYKKLLEYLKNFDVVSFYRPPYTDLFSTYLRAHGIKFSILSKLSLKTPSFLSFGVLLQVLITFLSIPILTMRRRHIMLFTSEKFEKSKDYVPGMKFIYQELRGRNLPFVEYIRSLESWKTVLKHAFVRKRPVIYSKGVAFIGRFLSVLSGGRVLARRKFGAHVLASQTDQETRFKFLVATHYLLGVYDDIWAIRIMKWILRAIGIKSAIITAASERNFHFVLGCKLNSIPTVGILHGVASRHYNVYDFMPGFDGKKMLTVDKYGLWSEWWRQYYVKNSKAYRPEQLFVSGPMRPLQKSTVKSSKSTSTRRQKISVLFVSEIVAVPTEVMPYLEALMEAPDFSVYIKFRPEHDRFEKWLKNNRPDILDKFNKDRLLKGSMQEAIGLCDIAVGSQSTGVIEAALQSKPFVLFNTNKWGDYYSMGESDKTRCFFAENPVELIEKIKVARFLPSESLAELREQYFGDPYKNGSKWVVEQAEKNLQSK